jgi:hypothetical protein
MRILIASSGTIPGYSGGWTTLLDLLGDEHEVMYVIPGMKLGLHKMEGVPWLGLGLGSSPGTNAGFRHRLAARLGILVSPIAVKWAFRKTDARFILCLDKSIGLSVLKTGLPYAMRFHSWLKPSDADDNLKTLLNNALFSTATYGADVPGVEILPHYQDLSRFQFSSAVKPEKALLLTSINEVHEPELFIEGVCRSKNMKGDIIGTGPLRKHISKLCSSTGGRVRCLKPIPRLKLGRLSGEYQIGVATIINRGKTEYQMKVNMYLACGMHTLVKPYTHINREAPGLVDTFSSSRELADRLDEVEGRWRELDSRRVKGREWVMENCSVDIPRRRFKEILKATFPDYRKG